MSPSRILDATATVAQEEGFAGVSMRVIAQRLGVSATALYRHVANKTDLLDRFAERLMRQAPRLDPDQPWEQRLRHFIMAMQEAFLRYPGLNRHMVTRANTPAAQIWVDTVLGILVDAGLSEDAVCDAFEHFSYLIDPRTLLDDSPAPAARPSMGATIERLRRVHPALAAHLASRPPMPSAESFANTLDRVIAAVAAEARTDG